MTSETDKTFNPIKTNKLKTFFAVRKTAIARIISETVSPKESSDMLNRLLNIGKSRDIDLAELLSYALSSVPMALGTADGTPCKTVKAKLMHDLEKDIEPLVPVPGGSALIVGMTFIYQIHAQPSTFGQLADILLEDLMHMAIQCRYLRVDFVCDQYHVQSIKNCEREPRAMCGTQGIHITRPDQKTPKQFKNYLANGRNKELLINDRVHFKCWTMWDPGILGNILLVVSHGEVCHSIVLNYAVGAITEVPDLFLDHEEADTRLLIHAHQAAQVLSSVTIKSHDTDVMVLSLAKCFMVVSCFS